MTPVPGFSENVGDVYRHRVTRTPSLRYRSSIRIMVRGGETRPTPTSQQGHAPRGKVRRSSRSGVGEGGAKMSIVRAQIRLPKELDEKMPSAPTTPANDRKKPLPLPGMGSKKQKQTVASMVRR